MYVAELDLVWIPVLVATYRPDWRMYRVPRDALIIGDLVEAVVRFWNEHVLPQIPPDPSLPPPIEILVQRLRNPGSMIELPAEASEWASRYEVAHEEGKEADQEKETAKRNLLAMLGDAEAGRLPDGRLISFRLQNGQRQCNVDRLLREHPEIYQELVYQKASRHFRILKGARKP
jgi:predicted phage-related endonuclease